MSRTNGDITCLQADEHLLQWRCMEEVNAQQNEILKAVRDLPEKTSASILIRNEDIKLACLVNILEKKKIISPEDVNVIFGMEPFPQGR